MVDYVIINSTAAELTNVNAGGDDVAAHTISANITLTNAELATVASTDGVAVMQASASAAEKRAVGNELLGGGAGVAPGVSYKVANGSASELTNVNAAGDDVPAYERLTATLTPSELVAALGTDGVAVVKATSDNEETRIGGKILVFGAISSKIDS